MNNYLSQVFAFIKSFSLRNKIIQPVRYRNYLVLYHADGAILHSYYIYNDLTILNNIIVKSWVADSTMFYILRYDTNKVFKEIETILTSRTK